MLRRATPPGLSRGPFRPERRPGTSSQRRVCRGERAHVISIHCLALALPAAFAAKTPPLVVLSLAFTAAPLDRLLNLLENKVRQRSKCGLPSNMTARITSDCVKWPQSKPGRGRRDGGGASVPHGFRRLAGPARAARGAEPTAGRSRCRAGADPLAASRRTDPQSPTRCASVGLSSRFCRRLTADRGVFRQGRGDVQVPPGRPDQPPSPARPAPGRLAAGLVRSDASCPPPLLVWSAFHSTGVSPGV